MNRINHNMRVHGLSKLLRHTECECIDDEGWVPLVWVSQQLNVRTNDIIQQALHDNKGRYEYDEESCRIRARYGHTINIPCPAWIHHPMKPGEIKYVMHATTQDAWDAIQHDGYIRPMERMAVHFAACTEALRKNPIVLHLDVERALSYGIRLYWASRQIVVTPDSVPFSLIRTP